MNCDWWIPKNTDNPADWNAADRAREFHCGWFQNPIFINGDYPEVMKEFIARKSLEQGLNVSRLPTFTEQQKTMLKGKGKTVFLQYLQQNFLDYVDTTFIVDLK